MNNIKWNEYTWYSRLGAILLFILVLPLLAFLIGKEYEKTMKAVDVPIQVNDETSIVRQQRDTSIIQVSSSQNVQPFMPTSDPIVNGQYVHTNEQFGYAFAYPQSWQVAVGFSSESAKKIIQDEWPGSGLTAIYVQPPTASDPGDAISIYEVASTSVTTSSGKRGSVTYWYDNNTDAWMISDMSDKYESGQSQGIKAILPNSFTASGLPVFGGTCSWSCSIVALSHNKFLIVASPGSGDTNGFLEFVSGIYAK